MSGMNVWAGRCASVWIAVAGLAASVCRASDDPELTARLDAMVQKLDARRAELHIPGLSIAVVKDGKMVYAKGLGLRDVEKNIPADPETVYAIGSSTKAFTATLVGTLVDEGKMSWDEPAATHLPGFALSDPDVNSKVTLRDLMCHRIGLVRTELPWASGKATREQMLACIARAELKDPFRTKFNYNNVMFMAAGQAAANAGGSTWDAMIKDRLLTPLGMKTSTTSVADAQRDPRLSTGYRWAEDEKSFKVLPMRPLTAIAPAGAINSNVLEMSRWVRLQLARGEFEGKRIVQPKTVEETWTKQIEVQGDIGYGLGWFLRQWEGKRLIEHGGNIDGFASTVAFLPDDNCGFVMLENVTASALQGEAIGTVFRAVFPAPASADANAWPAEKMNDLTGKYRFDAMGIDCTVQVKDAKLHLDVPGQTLYELKWPNAEGKWFFALTDTIAVRFDRGGDGKVESITMFQAGMEFNLPRKGVEAKPDPNAVPVAQLQKYLGKFEFVKGKPLWTVLVKSGKLHLDVPGETTYPLKWPDADGKWALAPIPNLKVSFDVKDDGSAMMKLYRPEKVYDLPRVEGGTTNAWPSVDDLMAKRLASVRGLVDLGDTRLTGTVRFANQGVEGAIIATFRGTDRFRQDMDLGVFGRIRTAAFGGRAWTETMAEPLKEIKGAEFEEAMRHRASSLADDLRRVFDAVEVEGIEKVGDHEAVIVKATKKDGSSSTTQYLDPATGLAIKERTTASIENAGKIPITIAYDDFRDLGGVLMPFSMTVDSDLNGRTIITFSKAETKLGLSDAAYTLEPGKP